MRAVELMAAAGAARRDMDAATVRLDRIARDGSPSADAERAELSERMGADAEAVRRAMQMVYGDGSPRSGLVALAPRMWCDAAWLRFVEGSPWPRVGSILLIRWTDARRWAIAALDMADAHGLADLPPADGE